MWRVDLSSQKLPSCIFQMIHEINRVENNQDGGAEKGKQEDTRGGMIFIGHDSRNKWRTMKRRHALYGGKC